MRPPSCTNTSTTDYMCNGWKVEVNRTTSMPMSVPCLVLDKVRLLSISESILQCFYSMEWMLPFCILVWDQYLFYFVFLSSKNYMWKVYYLMCPPLSPFHPYIKINITDNRHFALVYLLGKTRLTFTRSMAHEPSIYEEKKEERNRGLFYPSINLPQTFFCSLTFSLYTHG